MLSHECAKLQTRKIKGVKYTFPRLLDKVHNRSYIFNRKVRQVRMQADCMDSVSTLSAADLEKLNEEVFWWSAMHGLLMKADGKADPTGVGLIHVPVSLLPAMPIPRETYHKAIALAEPFNKLVEVVSNADHYLESILAKAANMDDFTQSLLKVYSEVLSGGRPEVARRSLAINRSDYLLDANTQSILQVELNTISSSFGAHSTLTSRLHRHLIGKFDFLNHLKASSVPENDTIGDIVDAFAQAVAEYKIICRERLMKDPGDCVVLMVVQPDERNVLDQQLLEDALYTKHNVRMIRMTLDEIHKFASFDEQNCLHVRNQEIALVYLRAGYSPSDYKGPNEWNARSLLENSQAFKCPSVAYQLAGSKKVQQHLAESGVLEKFVENKDECQMLKDSFAKLWSLDDQNDSNTKMVIEDAKANPGNYVLKPQREGGGNNLYDEEMKEKLEANEDLSAYILMQRIKSNTENAYLLNGGKCTNAETLSELGIYGIYLTDDGRELINKASGSLVRTKLSSSNEGGVTAGYACLSTPYMV